MSEDAVPTEDPKNAVDLLFERLSAWKHVVDKIEDYMSTTEKALRNQAKEYQKVLKTLQSPLKAGHHFDQNVGGIASLLENMRQNTQGLVNTYHETEQNVKGSVLPAIEHLRKEIKNQSRELSSEPMKSAKEVERARNLTQKHIELLGQNVAGFESTGSRLSSTEDPYVLHRGVLHYLSKQLMEENNQREVLISLQKNFEQFEQHIIEVIQTSLASLTHFSNIQAQSQQEHYSDIMKTAQVIPHDFEWKKFLFRSGDILIDPNIPHRSLDTVTFPNQDHRATNSIIEGTLERKSRNRFSFSGFTSGYYVVTLSKFLHEFKDEDFVHKDPVPELSIYLPEATIWVTNGEKFDVKGKDASSAEEAQKWVNALQNTIGLSNLTTSISSQQIVPIQSTETSSPPTYSAESPVDITEKETQSQKTDDETQESPVEETSKALNSNLDDDNILKSDK